MCQADPAPSLLDMAFALLAAVANWRVTQLSSSLPFVDVPLICKIGMYGGLNNTEDPGVLFVCCVLCVCVCYVFCVVSSHLLTR